MLALHGGTVRNCFGRQQRTNRTSDSGGGATRKFACYFEESIAMMESAVQPGSCRRMWECRGVQRDGLIGASLNCVTDCTSQR